MAAELVTLRPEGGKRREGERCELGLMAGCKGKGSGEVGRQGAGLRHYEDLKGSGTCWKGGGLK